MNLEALPGSGSEVVLAVVCAQVIHELVQLGRHFTGGGLEAEHELVFLRTGWEEEEGRKGGRGEKVWSGSRDEGRCRRETA